jgi:hypothetical protein
MAIGGIGINTESFGFLPKDSVFMVFRYKIFQKNTPNVTKPLI